MSRQNDGERTEPGTTTWKGKKKIQCRTRIECQFMDERLALCIQINQEETGGAEEEEGKQEPISI